MYRRTASATSIYKRKRSNPTAESWIPAVVTSHSYQPAVTNHGDPDIVAVSVTFSPRPLVTGDKKVTVGIFVYVFNATIGGYA